MKCYFRKTLNLKIVLNFDPFNIRNTLWILCTTMYIRMYVCLYVCVYKEQNFNCKQCNRYTLTQHQFFTLKLLSAFQANEELKNPLEWVFILPSRYILLHTPTPIHHQLNILFCVNVCTFVRVCFYFVVIQGANKDLLECWLVVIRAGTFTS